MRKFFLLLLLGFFTISFSQSLRIKLPNGLTIIACRRETKQLVSIVAIIRGGSGVEKTAGAGNLLLKLMPLGTRNYDKDEIAKILEDDLIDMQTEININYWGFYLFCPTKSLEQALHLLREILFYPLFDEYEFEKEKKKAILESEEVSAQPFVKAYACLREIIYGDTDPYGRLINGTKKSLEKLNIEELRFLHLTYFHPQNLFLSIVGDVDPDATIKIAEGIFGPLPKGDRISFAYPFYRPLVRPEAEVISIPSPFAYLLIGLPLPGINHTDYPILQVIATLLGEGTSSRLARALRWRMGISYELGALYPPLIGKSHLLLWATIDPGRVEEAREAIINELTSLENVDEQELEKAKNKLLGNYIITIASIKEQAFRMAFFEAIGLGYQYMVEFPKIIGKITLADVKRVIRRYIKGNTALVLIMPSS